MELPGTAAPWLVLGVVLGILVPVLAGLAVGTLRRRAAPAPPVTPPPPALADDGADDLPGFLASPPGSTPAPAAPAAGWPPLSAPATPPPAAPSAAEPAHGRTGSTGLLVALALTALLLIGAAAAVAATGTGDPTVAEAPDPTGEPEPGATGTAPPGEVSAELTFEGVVLERHAVGVTAAYPRMRLTAERGRAVAELELATFNCLRDEAPEDPVAAGCTRSIPEYAELRAPELGMTVDDAGVRIWGAFPTSRRPNGSPPVPTGRVYQLEVSAAARDGRVDAGTESATGRLRLGNERAVTRDDGPNEITYGG